MQVKFWGVRGSLPHSLSSAAWVGHIEKVMKDFLSKGHSQVSDVEGYLRGRSVLEIGGFGTATTCVQVSDGGQSLIIDGGSGIKSISDELVKLPSAQQQKVFHIILTHFHFDHIMGLPFFLPHFFKGSEIHYYAPHEETDYVIKSFFQKPMFPVTFSELSADIYFHHLTPHEKNNVNGFEVTPYKTDHPDLCFGYKVEKNGRSYSHAVDNEAVRLTAEELGADAGLYRNTDLLYFDAQYDEEMMGSRKGWGHGTSHRAFEICARFGIKQILLAHHDPSFSIEDSLGQKKKTELIYQKNYAELDLNWDYAYEGLSVEV